MNGIERGWPEPVKTVFANLDTRPDRLPDEEARRRHTAHGPNSLPEAPRPSPPVRLAVRDMMPEAVDPSFGSYR